MELEEIQKNQKVTFKAWIIELLQDERGGTSVKPVIALLGALTLCIMMVINAVLKTAFNPSGALVDAVMVITSIGMGADSLDKFSLKGHSGTTDGSTVLKQDDPPITPDKNIGQSSNQVL